MVDSLLKGNHVKSSSDTIHWQHKKEKRSVMQKR